MATEEEERKYMIKVKRVVLVHKGKGNKNVKGRAKDKVFFLSKKSFTSKVCLKVFAISKLFLINTSVICCTSTGRPQDLVNVKQKIYCNLQISLLLGNY